MVFNAEEIEDGRGNIHKRTDRSLERERLEATGPRRLLLFPPARARRRGAVTKREVGTLPSRFLLKLRQAAAQELGGPLPPVDGA